MRHVRNLLGGAAVALVVVLMAIVMATPRSAPAFTVPSGFYVLIPASGGVTVYKKDAPRGGGSPDYVTVVDMKQGTFTQLHGAVEFKAGDANGRVQLQPFKDFVTAAKNKESRTKKLVAVVNGVFHDPRAVKTTLSHGLKSNGTVISYGSDLSGFPGKYRTLAIKPDRANVLVHDNSTFDDRSIPDVVGGLDVTAPVDEGRYRPRTIIGLRNDDRDRDGTLETVFIYSSKLGKAMEAGKILKDFGADPNKIIQLDGGSSGALNLANKPNDSYQQNPVPQVLAVYSGK